MAKEKVQNQVLRAKAVLHLIEKFTGERKALYEELDGLIEDLRQVPNLEAKGLAVRDAFAKGNTQWGHGPVRRFTLELLEAPPAAAGETKPPVVKPAKKTKVKVSADK